MAILNPVPEPSLRTLVAEELADSRRYDRSRVRKWILFSADLGYTKLCLDECPGLSATASLKELAAWLESEGFVVKVPRLGRITVYLENEDE